MRKDIEGSKLEAFSEQRSVVVVFCSIRGLEGSLSQGGEAALPAVQRALEASLRTIRASGGSLRQYMLDDKGMVLIWTFGLQLHTFEDSASRGLQSALDVAEALGAQQLTTLMGVTSGTVFCGLVGSTYRHEYSVMGPAVNLAARLMGMCAKLDVALLCNEDVHRQVRSHRTWTGEPPTSAPLYGLEAATVRSRPLTACGPSARIASWQAVSSASTSAAIFTFTPYEPMSVKGYAQPVRFFGARLDRQRTLARETLSQMEVEWFYCLSPTEQATLLSALAEQRFSKGEEVVSEGDEGDAFFIITEGSCLVTQESNVALRRKLGRGHHFGELALLHGEPRSATVTAVTAVTCMVIDRQTFSELIGPLADVLKRKDGTSSPPRRPSQARLHVLSTAESFGRALAKQGRGYEARLLASRVELLTLAAEPSLTLITGEPGMGKTHLLREVSPRRLEAGLEASHQPGSLLTAAHEGSRSTLGGGDSCARPTVARCRRTLWRPRPISRALSALGWRCCASCLSPSSASPPRRSPSARRGRFSPQTCAACRSSSSPSC